MDGTRQLHADADRAEGEVALPASMGRLIVAIPTTGRAPILTPTLRAISAQTKRPDEVILSITEKDDVEPDATEGLAFPVRVLRGPKGLCQQRNRILERLGPDDLLLMLDDDFLMAPDYLARLDALFAAHPDVAMATGTVLADGVVGRGLSPEDGAEILRAASLPRDAGAIRDVWNGYGCNFAMRARPILAHGLRFDETLPLYGWLEDVDFSGQIAAHGRIVRSEGLLGVHLGTKLARSPGRRLGYSQIANPVYLLGKRTIRREHARRMMLRNFASNLLYAPVPRPWTDSRGRLAGNLMALWDWARGRLDPGRVRDL